MFSPKRTTSQKSGNFTNRSKDSRHRLRSGSKNSRISGVSDVLSGRSGISGLKSLNGLGNVATMLAAKNKLKNVNKLQGNPQGKDENGLAV